MPPDFPRGKAFDPAGLSRSNTPMLGRVRRTTRTDVGLCMSLAGIAYLLWVGVTASVRVVVNDLADANAAARLAGEQVPAAARWLVAAFGQTGPAWDLAGVLWLGVTLALVLGSSRQRWIISWPWLSAICHAMAAGLLGVWAALAAAVDTTALAGAKPAPAAEPICTAPPTVGWTSLSVAVALAVVIWVFTLVWMLRERSLLLRGPSPGDFRRTHAER